MSKSFGHLIGTLTQNQGEGCIRNQVSLSLGLCLSTSRTRTSAPALSLQPYSPSLAAWSNLQLSVFTGGGTSLRGNHGAAHPQMSMTWVYSHRRKNPQGPVPALKQAESGVNLTFSSWCKSRSMAAAPLPPLPQFCVRHLLFCRYEPDTSLRNYWKLNK